MGRAASEQYIWKYILLRGEEKGNSKESLKILIYLPWETFAKKCINVIFLSKIANNRSQFNKKNSHLNFNFKVWVFFQKLELVKTVPMYMCAFYFLQQTIS